MPQTFYLKLEPTGQPGIVKATAVEAPPGTWGPDSPIMGHPIAPGGTPPGIWGPDSPIMTPPIVIPPIDAPPSPPEAKLVAFYQPTAARWMYGYQAGSGAGPKKVDPGDPCEPPAPPGFVFGWFYVPQYNGWVWGYTRESGAGPK
jgi:hypothetical protein